MAFFRKKLKVKRWRVEELIIIYVENFNNLMMLVFIKRSFRS